VRLLLDTHAFLWWVAEQDLLGEDARRAIGDRHNEVFASVVCAWEIVVKKKLNRLAVPDDVPKFIRGEIAWYGFSLLPLTLEHALRVHDLRDHPAHKDPFDRLLVAQALAEDMTLVSKDLILDTYGVERVW